MARVLLIHNPSAARTKPDMLARLTGVFEAEGWTLEVAGTTAPGDAVVLARQGADAGVDVVAVYGGDGTMIQAVGGLLGRGIPVGVIPGGTGNLLAGNLGLPRNPLRAARVIARGAPRAIDLGRMRSGETVRHFAVACGAGFDAELMSGTSPAAKSRWGMAAYVANAVRLLHSSAVAQYELSVDGERLDVLATTVMVANCGQIMPPYLRLKKDIEPDDGFLDIVALKASGWVEAVTVVSRLLSGRSNGGRSIRYARGRSVTLQCERPCPAQLDGEAAGTTPFAVDVIPKAMEIIVPRG